MAKTKKETIIKKKKWFPILSPALLGEKQIGETYLEEIEFAIGRKVAANLMQVTGDIKSQNSSMKFEVTEAKENRLLTKVVEYSYLSSSIKRLIRRRMTRIDDSIVAKTKDEKLVRIKPLLLTRSKVTRSVEKAVRASLRDEVITFVNSTPYEELFASIIKNRVQNDLKAKISKIYPVKALIIKSLHEETHHSAKESPRPKIVKKERIPEEKQKKEKKPKEEDDMDIPIEKGDSEEEKPRKNRKPN